MSDARTNKIIEAIKRQEENCRECTHMKVFHGPKIGCFDIIGIKDKLIRCDCKEFVPEDNLDYIEWVAKKRKLV